jgi:hypothetical protein
MDLNETTRANPQHEESMMGNRDKQRKEAKKPKKPPPPKPAP